MSRSSTTIWICSLPWVSALCSATTEHARPSSRPRFLDWCKTHGHLSEASLVPSLPKKAVGTPFKLRRRQAATQLEPAEILAILERLPEWSESKKVARFPIKARFVLQYEQGMRPEMLDALAVPKHYSKTLLSG
jgi:hypothetical protein